MSLSAPYRRVHTTVLHAHAGTSFGNPRHLPSADVSVGRFPRPRIALASKRPFLKLSVIGRKAAAGDLRAQLGRARRMAVQEPDLWPVHVRDRPCALRR